jgi:hypothetical protein
MGFDKQPRLVQQAKVVNILSPCMSSKKLMNGHKTGPIDSKYRTKLIETKVAILNDSFES